MKVLLLSLILAMSDISIVATWQFNENKPNNATVTHFELMADGKIIAEIPVDKDVYSFVIPYQSIYVFQMSSVTPDTVVYTPMVVFRPNMSPDSIVIPDIPGLFSVASVDIFGEISFKLTILDALKRCQVEIINGTNLSLTGFSFKFDNAAVGFDYLGTYGMEDSERFNDYFFNLVIPSGESIILNGDIDQNELEHTGEVKFYFGDFTFGGRMVNDQVYIKM